MQTLNRWSWLAGSIAVLLFAQACAKKQEKAAEKTAAAEAKPKIVVVEKKFNFGKVKQGEPVEHVFEIQNQGKADLVIENAVGSCGCLATVLSDKRIVPGAKGQVKATLSTAGRNGKQSKRIYLNSNDPVDGKLAIEIEGEVYSDVFVFPTFLWLKEIKIGEKSSREFSVTVHDPERVKIVSVAIDDKRFVIRRKSGDAQGNAAYDLEFRGGKKPESVSAQLSVTSEGSSNPIQQVPVKLEVVGDLRYPKVVQLFRREGKPAPVDVRFTSRSNKPFRLKRVEDRNKFLQLEVVESKAPNALIRAQLATDAAAVQPGKRYSFFVYTSDKIEPKVEIGYMIYQAPSSIRPTGPIAPPFAPPPGPRPLSSAPAVK